VDLDDERSETMNRPDARALIEALAQRAQADAVAAADRPPAEELLDYLRDDLDGEERRRVERRLVADPAAARALLDLAELEAAAAAADESHLADPETRGAWRDFEARLPRAGQAPRRGWFPGWLNAAAAALLLVAALGLGARVLVLERALRTPSAPVVVEVQSAARGGDETRFTVAPGATLALLVDPGAPCADPVVELGDPGGEWTRLAPRLGGDGLITLLVPRAAAGRYTLRVEGCEPRRNLVDTAFTVVTAGGGGDG
jgi:hypothetical protein